MYHYYAKHIKTDDDTICNNRKKLFVFHTISHTDMKVSYNGVYVIKNTCYLAKVPRCSLRATTMGRAIIIRKASSGIAANILTRVI